MTIFDKIEAGAFAFLLVVICVLSFLYWNRGRDLDICTATNAGLTLANDQYKTDTDKTNAALKQIQIDQTARQKAASDAVASAQLTAQQWMAKAKATQAKKKTGDDCSYAKELVEEHYQEEK